MIWKGWLSHFALCHVFVYSDCSKWNCSQVEKDHSCSKYPRLSCKGWKLLGYLPPDALVRKIFSGLFPRVVEGQKYMDNWRTDNPRNCKEHFRIVWDATSSFLSSKIICHWYSQSLATKGGSSNIIWINRSLNRRTFQCVGRVAAST